MISKLFIIAGEESGDNIGAKFLSQLKKGHSDIKVKGIGGNKMSAQGLISNFSMQEISLMGFLEILPHIPNLIKRINQTVEDILHFNPDVVLTIDSPGFNYRVAKKLKNKGYKGKLIHYVAPTVWAYKEKRAKKTAKIFDKLLCILPWEPPYFTKEGLDTKFVGHPIFEDMDFLDSQGKSDFRKNYLLSKDDIVISCLIGSRKGEVARLKPIFAEALQEISYQTPNLKIFILTTEDMKCELEPSINIFPKNTAIISDGDEKQKILQISNAAIVKSGTVGLEVASYKCPHVICYKVNALSYKIIKFMAKTELVNLVNISAQKEVIPELIQESCTPQKISSNILKLLNNKQSAKLQIEDSQIELKTMGLRGKTVPSAIAVKEVV